MNNLYFLSYNNYFNRIVKKEDTLQDYLPYAVGVPMSNVNFVPNDGISTTQVVNADYEFEGSPDYCIVCDPITDEIISRWFVVEASRLRSGQYDLKLKRDSIADNLDAVLDAKSFVVKGTVGNGNPLIFNKETNTVNQIKVKETLLKDSTETAWIVGYISPDVAKDHPVISGQIEGFILGNYDSWTNVPGYKHKDKVNVCFSECYVDASIGITSQSNVHTHLPFTGDYSWTVKYYTPWYNGGPKFSAEGNAVTSSSKWGKVSASAREKIFNDTITTKTTALKITETERAQLLSLNTTIIKVQGTIYQIIVKEQPIKDTLWPWNIEDKNNAIVPGVYNYGEKQAFNLGGNYLTIEYKPYTPLTNLTKFTYDFTNKDVSNETSPYGILCMPWNDNIDDNLSGKSRLKILQALGATNGLLYDIQILPYCPIRSLIVNPTTHTIIDTDPNAEFIKVNINTGTDEKPVAGDLITKIRVSRTPSFSFKIPCKIQGHNLKLINETKMWRLNSPNYNGSFEFNAAKFYHGGLDLISYFSVDCCYRPYSPYIHVAPEWNGLYGQNFNDARGLICGGDFSADRISDQWTSYQYENKNFQLQFDRQIETMELQKNIGFGESIANGLGQTTGSAIIGGAVGGPWAAAGMAAIGVAQTGYNAWAQQRVANDQIDATKDQQRWNLQNIQARPYGLTKVGVLNQNNKLFPFIEEYDATDEEKTIISNQIRYRGMTVNAVGKIRDYINIPGLESGIIANKNYIEATLIRLEGLREDSHMINDINNELAGGVYFND